MHAVFSHRIRENAEKTEKNAAVAPAVAKTLLLFLCKMEKMFGVLHENGESTLQSYKRK